MSGAETRWSPEVLARVQRLIDTSLESAGAVQRSFFGKPERRLGAGELLRTWNSIYMCAVASHGATTWPHLAAVKLEFDEHARLSMLLYLDGVRERDLRAQPRLALQKHRDDGTVITCYARAEAPSTEPVTDKRGRRHVQVPLTPVRLYGMGPYVSGPLATGGS